MLEIRSMSHTAWPAKLFDNDESVVGWKYFRNYLTDDTVQVDQKFTETIGLLTFGVSGKNGSVQQILLGKQTMSAPETLKFWLKS